MIIFRTEIWKLNLGYLYKTIWFALYCSENCLGRTEWSIFCRRSVWPVTHCGTFTTRHQSYHEIWTEILRILQHTYSCQSGSQNYTRWIFTRKPKICFFLTFVLSINSTLRGHRTLKIHPWILIISQTNIIYFTIVNGLARYISRVSGVISINCPDISRVSVPEMSDQGLNSSGISITNNLP